MNHRKIEEKKKLSHPPHHLHYAPIPILDSEFREREKRKKKDILESERERVMLVKLLE